ncbi:MAG: hypothetical protein JRJ05_02375 [Deltaproteobacteria bacterium]|nr:hypothetical protein [Deltaproteobacteria bacterium]
MKAQSAALAMAALVLWLIPSGSLAQGNSGKSRLTICHIPPGNPDARHTMTVSEQAWRAHEAHGDYLGPCEGSGDEYGDDAKSAKKGKKGKKGGKKARSGSDGDEVVDADTRTRREKRQAERRARREQSARDGKAADDGDAEEAEAGGADTGTDDTQAAQRRARREARAQRRAAQATQPDAETEDSPEEEQGFFRGMRQFFGFGGDEGEESSGEAVE